MADRLRAAVALGAGGARGYAHIGVLEVLDERGFDVVAIAGTSMGAAIGGVAAGGKLAEYTEWARGLTQRDVWRLLDPSITATGGMFRADRVVTKVGEILEDATIESLAIPFTTVATDLAARREVWFQHGPVVHAIRASCAIPGVITPIVINGRTLVDGGLLNPVPIEPTAAVHSDVTVAVNLAGTRAGTSLSSPVKETSADTPREEWTSRLRRSTAEILESERVRGLANRFNMHRREASDAPHEAPLPAASAEEWVVGPADVGMLDLINLSYETMSAAITRFRMASSPPDILITVPSNAVGTLEFHKASEMIDLGRNLTTAALDHAGY